MAERKAINRYIPPDFDPEIHKSINGYGKVSHLRKRIKSNGTMIIRIELPFGIWCDGCKNLIGKGTRFNAIKRQVGMYYSSKVFEFEINCKDCHSVITLQSDPKNTDYVVTRGGRRQMNKQSSNSFPLTNSKETKDEMELLEYNQKKTAQREQQQSLLDSLYLQELSSKQDFDINYQLRKLRKKKDEQHCIKKVDCPIVLD
ncbi:C-cdc13, putative [Entamoeba histolytica KU27]|uniref:C-cdc13, putative n=1 Tax=Entamoeba histolytica KU27 TaxID=885311 RepID=M2SE88_ENTHI|nr:C-cdc13, putative [Entamoeba histolytica KU27]